MKPTVYLIGGTTEANRAARRMLDSGFRVVNSVTSEHGRRLSAVPADTGSKDAARMAAAAKEAAAFALVDSSHPYAIIAHREARHAASLANISYIRYSRAASAVDGAVLANSWEEAVRRLANAGGRSLLTVGVRHLALFADAGLDFCARVLPLADSLAECERLGIRPQDIIAAHPPFSVDFNRLCIRHARATVLVSKDSGQEGGLPAKLEAARAESIPAMVIARPSQDDAIDDLDELMHTLDQLVEEMIENEHENG